MPPGTLTCAFAFANAAETTQIRIQIGRNARAAVSRGVSRRSSSRTRLLTNPPAWSRASQPAQTLVTCWAVRLPERSPAFPGRGQLVIMGGGPWLPTTSRGVVQSSDGVVDWHT